jgi:hypothetical protein
MLERQYRRSLRADDRLAWVQQVRAMHALNRVKEANSGRTALQRDP